MKKGNYQSLAVIAIVAIVAIAGLVMIFMDGGATGAVPAHVYDVQTGQNVAVVELATSDCKFVGADKVACPGADPANVQLCVEGLSGLSGDALLTAMDTCVGGLQGVSVESQSASDYLDYTHYVAFTLPVDSGECSDLILNEDLRMQIVTGKDNPAEFQFGGPGYYEAGYDDTIILGGTTMEWKYHKVFTTTDVVVGGSQTGVYPMIHFVNKLDSDSPDYLSAGNRFNIAPFTYSHLGADWIYQITSTHDPLCNSGGSDYCGDWSFVTDTYDGNSDGIPDQAEALLCFGKLPQSS